MDFVSSFDPSTRHIVGAQKFSTEILSFLIDIPWLFLFLHSLITWIAKNGGMLLIFSLSALPYSCVLSSCRSSPLSASLWTPLSHSFSATACGSRKCHLELVIFSYHEMWLQSSCHPSMVQTPLLQFWQTCQGAPLVSTVMEGSCWCWDWFRARLRGVTVN